jgi:hypothetical protein
MILNENRPAREFKVGLNNKITIKDCGTLTLRADEQVTLITEDGKEYDVARKNWGFYATPSANGRLKNFGFKTAKVRNAFGMLYIMLVEEDKLEAFNAYIEENQQEVIEWLDELPVIS